MNWKWTIHNLIKTGITQAYWKSNRVLGIGKST